MLVDLLSVFAGNAVIFFPPAPFPFHRLLCRVLGFPVAVVMCFQPGRLYGPEKRSESMHAWLSSEVGGWTPTNQHRT